MSLYKDLFLALQLVLLVAPIGVASERETQVEVFVPVGT
jgi:hypothetical protein